MLKQVDRRTRSTAKHGERRQAKHATAVARRRNEQAIARLYVGVVR